MIWVLHNWTKCLDQGAPVDIVYCTEKKLLTAHLMLYNGDMIHCVFKILHEVYHPEVSKGVLKLICHDHNRTLTEALCTTVRARA